MSPRNFKADYTLPAKSVIMIPSTFVALIIKGGNYHVKDGLALVRRGQ